MKILIVANCAAKGEYLEAGKVYEVDSNVAIELIQIGRAVNAPAEELKPKPTRRVRSNGAD
jgi:hypothetical protein